MRALPKLSLIGLHFQIETDHKPLVPLLSAKPLDQLPIRVQRFRLRMMRFDYVITHVPGKNLQILLLMHYLDLQFPQLQLLILSFRKM